MIEFTLKTESPVEFYRILQAVAKSVDFERRAASHDAPVSEPETSGDSAEREAAPVAAETQKPSRRGRPKKDETPAKAETPAPAVEPAASIFEGHGGVKAAAEGVTPEKAYEALTHVFYEVSSAEGLKIAQEMFGAGVKVSVETIRELGNADALYERCKAVKAAA